MHLNSFADSQELKACTNRRMLDCGITINVFYFRVRYSAVIIKEGGQMTTGNIATLVDGRRQHGAAMFAIPKRIIGATSKKRYAQRSACNYHRVVLLSIPNNDLYSTTSEKLPNYGISCLTEGPICHFFQLALTLRHLW